jgi:hypothetical protein
MPPDLHLSYASSPFALVIFEIGSCFCPGLSELWSSYLCFH